MQYVTQRFENTSAGLAQKDAYSRQMAAQGYHIVSEQLERGALQRRGTMLPFYFMYPVRVPSWTNAAAPSS